MKDIEEIRVKMRKSVDFFKDELSKIRGSRANPHLLEDIIVPVYGSNLPIKQLATVTVVDPTLITVLPWDKNNINDINKAVENANLNLNPSSDGNIIRVPLPPLTEERRLELIKIIKKKVEDARIAIRRIRREFLDTVDKEELSEDIKDRMEKDLQQIVDDANSAIDHEFKRKQEELLAI
jgi:ribosome recycling factor